MLVLMPCFLQFQQETCMAIGPNRPFATVGHMFVSYSRVFFDVSSARHKLRTTKQGGAAEKTEALRLSVLWSLLFFFRGTSVPLRQCFCQDSRHVFDRIVAIHHHTIRTVQSWTASAVSEPATLRYRVQATAGDDQLPHFVRCVAGEASSGPRHQHRAEIVRHC